MFWSAAVGASRRFQLLPSHRYITRAAGLVLFDVPRVCVIRFLFSVALTALLVLPSPSSLAQYQSSPQHRSSSPTAEAHLDDGRITPGGRRAERRLHSGVASFYARSLHGRRTANGERYNHQALTAAHRSLPFGTLLRVENTRTGRRVLLRVNDRGPFVRGRVLDVSGAAAGRLGMRGAGTARVTYEIVRPSSLPSRRPPPPRKVKHV